MPAAPSSFLYSSAPREIDSNPVIASFQTAGLAVEVNSRRPPGTRVSANLRIRRCCSSALRRNLDQLTRQHRRFDQTISTLKRIRKQWVCRAGCVGMPQQTMVLHLPRRLEALLRPPFSILRASRHLAEQPAIRQLRSGPRFTPRAAVSQDQPTAHVAQESTWPAGPQVT
jgi:hypothetical protein